MTIQAESGASQSGLRSPTQGSEFTKGPWYVGQSAANPGLIWIDSDHVGISGIADLYHKHDDGFFQKANAEANALRIVHCVNLHDELVEALEVCLSWVEDLEAERGEKSGAGNMARTTLAKARGGK